jgi:hypothetical protein
MSDSELLSLEYQQILRDQVIDENGPGTILKDFEIILDFIGSDGVMVSASTNQLPLKVLGELNSRLTNPLEIDLKRPRQKSYPNIHGLYLILRASGLCVVQGSGNKSRLVIENGVLDSWKALNPTERYFNLLETWMIRGVPEIIGETNLIAGAWIPECERFFERIPQKGLKIAGTKNEEIYIAYSIGLYGLALLNLFGFISLEQLKPEKGKGWRIAGIHRTAFGDALLQLLLNEFWRNPGDLFCFHGGDNEIEDTIGAFQPAITPFFPQWRNNLTIPKRIFQDGTYVFKLSLAGDCWRRIVISGEMDLECLSTTILDAFDFDHDHLYEFKYKNRFGSLTHVCHPHMEGEPLYTDEILIGDIPLQPGGSMIYLFDFGDNWEFNVELERIDPIDKKMKKPRVIESFGEAPEQYPSWDE